MRMRVIFAAAGILSFALGANAQTDPVARGKYLVTIMGCGDCHTPTKPNPNGPPIPDAARLLSGHPQELAHPIWTPADQQQRNAIGMAGLMLTAWSGPWGSASAPI